MIHCKLHFYRLSITDEVLPLLLLDTKLLNDVDVLIRVVGKNFCTLSSTEVQSFEVQAEPGFLFHFRLLERNDADYLCAHYKATVCSVNTYLLEDFAPIFLL